MSIPSSPRSPSDSAQPDDARRPAKQGPAAKQLRHRRPQEPVETKETAETQERFRASKESSGAPETADRRDIIDVAYRRGTPEGLDAAWLKLPFGLFLKTLFEWAGSMGWEVDDDPLFWVVRMVKSHEQVDPANVAAAYERVLTTIDKDQLFMPQALGANLATEDGMVAFGAAWQKVRFLHGVDPLTVAYDLAEWCLLEPPKKHLSRDYPRFLTVAFILQLERPRQVILLPFHTLIEERYFSCQLNTIGSWIDWAIRERLLKKTRPHSFRPGRDALAAEYVFAIHRYRDQIPAFADRLSLDVTEDDIAWIAEHFGVTGNTN